MIDPLVSIGIPCFNGEKTIEKTISFLLEQSYRKIEIIISDDNSQDNTKNILKKFNDERIRIFYQNKNLGSTENFKNVLSKAKGLFFMWLAQDDWIDSNYIEVIIKYFKQNNEYVLISGDPKFYLNGFAVKKIKKAIDIFNDDDPIKRMIQYITTVEDNSIFYGVTRTNLLRSVNYTNFLGNDWMIVLGLLFQGKAKQIKNVYIYRDIGGTGKSFKNIVRVFRLNKLVAYFPYLFMSFYFTQSIFSSQCFFNCSIYQKIKISFLISLFMQKRIFKRRFLKIINLN